MKILKFLGALAATVILTGCGGRAFIVEPAGDSQFRDRAIEKTDGEVTVRAAVLNPEETERVFGLSLYDQGIQPIWIEVVNGTNERIRYAPVGTDPEYFSPLEVSYKNRSGYSDEARDEMDRLLIYAGNGQARWARRNCRISNERGIGRRGHRYLIFFVTGKLA